MWLSLPSPPKGLHRCFWGGGAGERKGPGSGGSSFLCSLETREGLATPPQNILSGEAGAGVSAPGSGSRVGCAVPGPLEGPQRLKGDMMECESVQDLRPKFQRPGVSTATPTDRQIDTSNKVRSAGKKRMYDFYKSPTPRGPLVSWDPPPPSLFLEARARQDCPAAPVWGWWAPSHCAGRTAPPWAPAWGWWVLAHCVGQGALP